MHRYLFTFYKHGNMRFISHLDISRLFKRSIRKAEIEIAFSNGFNPHELINIVQPLSLGYETESDYLEIDTMIAYECQDLLDMMNRSMPEGIRLTKCREIERRSTNSSAKTEYALYEAVLPLDQEQINVIDIDKFLSQDKIYITKIDKKTKRPVQKDIRLFVRSIEKKGSINDPLTLELVLRCASNETLNPGKLLESLLETFDIEARPETFRIKRMDLLAYDTDGRMVSLYGAQN